MNVNAIWIFIKRVLSKNITVRALFLLGLIFRGENVVFNQNFNSDKELQIIAAQSARAGAGLRIPNAKFNDISQIDYEGYYQWPKGYARYFTLVYFFVRNVYWSAVLLDLIAVLLYFLSWRILIKTFCQDESKRNFSFNLFLILSIISNVPFIYLWSSDLIAISFYLFSICLLFTTEFRLNQWIRYFAGLAFLCLAVYTRYAYIPIVFALVIGFFLLYFKTRKKLYLLRFFLGIGVLAVFTILTNHSGNSPAFVNDSVRTGYHFTHTVERFNFLFPVQAILAGNTIHSMGKIFTIASITHFYLILLTLLILFVFVACLIRIMREYLEFKGQDENRVIILSSLFAGIMSVVLLIYLSLTRPIQKNDVLNDWTYVQEERYYAVMWMTILLAFFFVIVQEGEKGWLKKWILFILFASFCVDTPYYFYNKISDLRKNSAYFLTGEKKMYFIQYPKDRLDRDRMISDYEKLGTLIQDLEKENGIRPVYISADRSQRIAVIQGAVFGQPELLNDNLRTSRKQSIIIKISDRDPYPNDQLRAFVREKKMNPLYSGNIGSLYVYTLEPALH
jgi:hypothetical protein